ncbi:unnamed protein product [Rotaria sp. Silwood1]|nr:unnamed protein product [Rotaria sp. Silwood1]CAF4048969.1 unnamed protein product [Rotaria sp. Silwood1]CAF5029235.1 unnamed protein product [Rotaria sp. Silwood1]CAF5039142.1 unnamed protein product [Rotaria sp. Silwood1]CAF5140504.1 unnamed protein product [Rotaria sp. Silwood1]
MINIDLLEFRNYLNIKSKYIKYIKNDTHEKPTIVNEVRPRFECYKLENIKLHLDRCREYHSIHFQELLGKTTSKKLDLKKVMTSDEKKKLYDAICYEGEDTFTSIYPEELNSYCLYQMTTTTTTTCF